MTARIAYIVIAIVLAYKIFFLVPWAFVEGSFNVRDISLVMIWLGAGWVILTGAQSHALKHPFSVMILIYLFLVSIHISLARFYYDQSLIHGIIAARNQFIYVSLFLYLLLLEKPPAIVKLLDYLSVIAVVIVLLSFVNYIHPVVFHNWRSEEWMVERGGIQRAFVPGNALISMATVWMMCRWTDADSGRLKYLLATLVLVAGHFFAQSRGPIFGILAAFLVIVLLKRHFKEFAYMGAAALIGGIVITATLPENLLLTPFTTAVADISEGTGTVEGRIIQYESDVDEFMRHPWIGSGLVAIRSSEYSADAGNWQDIALKTRKADLGYSHWIKMYGLFGIIWLLAFMYLVGSRSYRLLRRTDGIRNTLAMFACAYFVFIAITGVTLNHFLIPERIVLFTLLAAIVARLEAYIALEPAASSPAPVKPGPIIQPAGSSRILRPRERKTPF